MKAKTVLVLFLIAVLSVSACAKWYSGIIHCHSTFSDGTRNPEAVIEKAIKAIVDFLCQTDHYEQIDKEKKIGSKIADDYGFDNYQKRFNSSRLVVLLGAEVTLSSHTLAIGDIKKDDILMNAKTQQEVIKRIRELGWLSIAAHPSSKKYLYDVNAADGINGIEFFNDDTNGGYAKTRDFYLSMLKKGENVFVTAGCDSHYQADPKDSARWKRITWVESEKLDKDSIFNALSKGRTYAINAGLSVKPFQDAGFYQPGFEYQEVARPKFGCSFIFEKKTKINGVNIYCDEDLIDKIEYKNSQKQYDFIWEDNKTPAGDHQYIIEIENYFITSPIRLKVKRQVGFEQILFCMEDKSGNQALRTINPDGSDLKKWMDWKDSSCVPSFSSDGTKMVFTKKVFDYGQTVYMQDLLTQNVTRIYPKIDDNEIFCESPLLSPDGKNVVFQRTKWVMQPNGQYSAFQNEVWSAKIDGSQAKILDECLSGIWTSCYSSDGKKIIFITGTMLCVYDLEEKKLSNLSGVPLGPNAVCPHWSPSGERIIYTGNDNSQSSKKGPWHDLYLIDLKSGKRKLLIGDIKYISDIDWSSDGKEIVLLVCDKYMVADKKSELVIINAQNPSQRKTIFIGGKISFVLWNQFHGKD